MRSTPAHVPVSPCRSRRQRITALAFAAASAACGALGAHAQTPPPEPAPPPAAAEPAPAPKWYAEISVNGFVSASWSYNLNRPASGTNQYRVFDFDDNSIKLDVAELVVQRPVAKPGDTGFRVDATAGASIPRMTAASGLFRDPATGKAEDFDLQQAFVSWIAPLGSGLRLDAGKFCTTLGYEVVEGYDGFNDHATRSFLFGYAEPVTHTGLKATYAFSGVVSANVMVANGWDVVKDNNSSKTLGGGVTFAPGPALSVTLNGTYGPERSGNDSDSRAVLDLVAVARPSGTVTLGLNVDWGTEPGAALDGGSAAWWGVAGYFRLDVSSTFSLAARADYFDDPDGARTGVAQSLFEVTLTPQVKVGTHLVFRSDLRVDFSSETVFEDRDGAFTKDREPTVLLNAIYLF